MTKNLLFILVFHFILLGALIPIFKNRDNFNFVVKALVVLLLTHFLLNRIYIGSPIPLLYGPIILLLYRNLYRVSVHRILFAVETLPFVSFLILYSFWEYNSLFPYGLYYSAAAALSLACYGLGVLLHWRGNAVKPTRQDVLIYQLVFMCLASAVFVLLMLLRNTSVLPEIVGTNIELFLDMVLLSSSLFIVRYFVTDKRKRKPFLGAVNSFQADVLMQSNELSTYQNLALNMKTFQDYENRLTDAFVQHKLYLSPELSLDKLAQVTDIPKHHFSQMFSVYLKTSFYQLVAQYRIAHAIKLLDDGTNITVESLAYECGFNSKTSFNRYFKDITGSTPSEYQNREKTAKV